MSDPNCNTHPDPESLSHIYQLAKCSSCLGGYMCTRLISVRMFAWRNTEALGISVYAGLVASSVWFLMKDSQTLQYLGILRSPTSTSQKQDTGYAEPL